MSLTIVPETPPRPDRGLRVSANRTVIVVAACFALAVVVGAVAWFGLRGSGAARPVAAAQPVAHLSPAAVLSRSLASAARQRSVHVEARFTAPGHRLRFADDDGRTDGIQRITVNGRSAVVKVIGRATYLRSDDALLPGYFGIPASLRSRYHQRWVRYLPGQPGYDALTEAITLSSALHEIVVQAPLTLLPQRQVDGVAAVGVRGRVTGAGAPKGATATLWTRTAAPYLPVEYDANGGGVTQVTRFTSWNEPVVVAAPTRWVADPVRPVKAVFTQQDAAVRSDLRNLATYEEMYFTDNGFYATAGSLQENFKLSLAPGDRVVIHLDSPRGYCLAGRTAAGRWWVYDSENGGSSTHSFIADGCDTSVYSHAGGTLP